MTLKLLLSLLFVVWKCTLAEDYNNHYLATKDIATVNFCSHDSYLNGACTCDVDYNGNFCLNRKCRNFGFNGRLGTDGQGSKGVVDRCICPPGFLGRNCEPVACVDGSQQKYSSSKDEKSISLLATYNTQMTINWKSGSIGDIVCNYTGYWRNFNYNFNNLGYSIGATDSYEICKTSISRYLDPDTCKDEDNNPIDCQQLNIDNLDTLVQNAPPNSIVFVVTNMKVASTDDAVAENIIATAIARRIQINVVVYNNTLPLLLASDPSLTYLSKIASATFGTFVLPSIASTDEQYGIVSTLLDFWNQDIGVSTILSNAVPSLPVDTTNDLFFGAQTYHGENLNINADSPTLVRKTDFWQLYKLSAGTFNPLLTVTGQVDGTPILVFSGNRLKAYSAFTSTYLEDMLTVDVAYGTSVNGASYPLVIRLESTDGVLEGADGFRTFGNPETFNLGNSINARIGCQFNMYTDAKCTAVGASVVTIITPGNKLSVSFPIYCASQSYAEKVYNNLDKEVVAFTPLVGGQSFSADISCSNEIGYERYGERSFVIICENTRDSNETISSVDNVFINENSIFYPLTDYLTAHRLPESVRYSDFKATLTNEAAYKFEQNVDYGTFMTLVINATRTSVSNAGIHASRNFSITDLLIQTIKTSNPYSDIFFVVNFDIIVPEDENEQTYIKTALAEKRSRLYVIFVQTYGTVPNNVYKYVNDLAVASGGVAVRLNGYDDMRRFFVQYYSLLVNNDIVAKSYAENQRAGIALNNVYLTTEQHVLLVTNEDLTGNGSVNASVSVEGLSVKALEQIGELQLFTLTPNKSEIYNIPVVFSTSGLAQWSNAILLSNTNTTQSISLSFVDKNGKNRNDVEYGVGEFVPFFYSTEPFGDGSTVSITYSDAQNPAKPIYTGNITTAADGCDRNYYNWTTDYKWICSVSGGLYHFKIDRLSDSGNITRTFPITCLGASSGDCLNGGIESANGCSCPLGWSGQLCEIPVCQNGGSVTTANTCDCAPLFSGDFCEIHNAICSSSPTTPDYRSDLSSLTIVADVQALAFSNLTTGLDITGIPINVIIYGDGNSPRLVQSTTNGQHLVEVLGTPSNVATPPPGTPDSLYAALNLALDRQITNRAFIVVLTSNPDANIDGDFLIRLAAKRAEIRVLSTADSTTLSDNYLTLSLIGNGIPIPVTSAKDFENYMHKYIAPLFQSLQYAKGIPQRVFNVFATGTIGSDAVKVVIPPDSTFDDANVIAFVHAYKCFIDNDGQFVVGDTRISTFSYNAKDGKSFELTEVNPGTSGLYLVETVSYLKTAYGFNNDTNGENEELNGGISSSQNNVLAISSAPYTNLPASSPENHPFLSIREITSNGTLTNASTIFFTRKTDASCFFKHFAVLNVCSASSIIGYQVQLTTRTNTLENRQQQFVLTCHRTKYNNNSTSCGGNGSPYLSCECDLGFTGIDCSQPICQNGGIRDVSVCRCPVQTYGRRCAESFTPLPPSTTPTTPSAGGSTTSPFSDSTGTTETPVFSTVTTVAPQEVRAVAFVIDVIGSDEYAFNQSTQAIVEYVKAFNYVHYVNLVANWNNSVSFGFQKYENEANLTARLNLFFSLRDQPSKVASLSKSLSAVLTSYNLHKPELVDSESSNIFYSTQIALAADDDPTDSLDGLDSFQKSSVVFSPFSQNADSSIIDSLKKFSDNVTNVRDYYNGVKTMLASTVNNDSAVLPDKPSRTCAFALQTNINIAIDRSLPQSPTIAENLETFLLNFRQNFNYIDNDEARCDQDLPRFYNERAAITSFIYYNSVVKTSAFCPSQYNTYLTATINGSGFSPDYSDRTMKYLGRNVNKMDCSCTRFNDTATTKYFIWLPRSPAPLNETFQEYFKFTTTNAYHFVVPFYESDKTTDLFYEILRNQGANDADYYMLPNAAENDVNKIISSLQEKLCETAGLDPTAIPPELSRMHFESRQNDFYDEFLD
ncbi:unnamed protein product [Caenorhabditis sp. 36 PRJEB53466]|nr:unnamed protein product [Caenorhabditis sp. 36 PRJEB53466]